MKNQNKMSQKANSTSWKPGQSGNPNGRPLGTKNAWTKAVQLYVQHIVVKYFKGEIPEITQTFEQDLGELSGKDRVKFFLQMITMNTPAKKEIRKSVEGEMKISVAYKSKKNEKAEEIIPIEIKTKSETMND